MLDNGMLGEDDRVELLDGWIVEKPMPGIPHDASVTRINTRLVRILGDEWVVRNQCSARLANSVPEPDFAIVRGPEAKYDSKRPSPRDIALLIEVADSSLGRDRNLKQAIYARDRVPVYWIVNVDDGIVEVYSHPRGGKEPCYQARTVYHRTDSVPLELFGEVIGELAVNDIIP
jgi:Uma2 family endonuclease